MAEGKRRLLAWRADPVLFAREVLGIEPWHAKNLGCDTQRDILRSCATNKRVAIRSGHKDGKSTLCAILALWEFVCWPGSRTIITAPTDRQIKEIIWKAITELYRGARIPLGGRLYKTASHGLIVEGGSQVFGFSTDDADKLSGISGDRVTYIIDEASGVDPAIFSAIAGNRMGGARLILIGNPTQPTGEFHSAFHSKARLYARHHMDSELVAAAVEDGRIPRIKGLANAEAVAEYAEEFGTDSDEYAVRVRGNFAASSATSIVKASDYDTAALRWTPDSSAWSRERLEIAVDVAHFGDDTSAIGGRRGRYVYEPEGHRQLDGPQLAMKVWAYACLNRAPLDGTAAVLKPRVRVELVGVGASCYDALRHSFGEWLEVVAFIPSASANDTKKYVNLRAEAWFNLRRVLSVAPYQLPSHERMRAEALAPGYKYDKDNRYQAESKKDVKQRLGTSPDFGDMLMMLLWTPPAGYGRAVHIPGL